MKIRDISPRISERLGVFPGDQPFSREQSLSFAQGGNFDLSRVRTTLHLGAHADSSSHYHPQGKGIEARPLSTYLGNCQVIEVNLPRGERILPRHLGGRGINARRVLFRTNSFPDPEHWNSDFCALSPELIDFLADRGVVLVGIDTPSVDPESSKGLESHQALFHRNIAVLEGLVLTQVPEGIFTLIALPLAIEGGDASPVRAVLLEKDLLEPVLPC